MKQILRTALVLTFFITSLKGQSGSINNTLGSGGTFTVKDGSTTFLTLSQTDGYLTLGKNLALSGTTSSTTGVVTKNGSSFIHDYHPSGATGFNTFLGILSGNFTMSGTSTQASYNTAVGASSLAFLTTGNTNSAFGYSSLFSTATGTANCAFGYKSLTSNDAGSENCAMGYEALRDNTSSDNCAFGYQALNKNTSGSNNCGFGFVSLNANVSGNSNSAFGAWSLANNTGSSNTGFGYSAGSNITSGSNNTCIGYNAQPSSATVSNQITLGDGSISSLRCNTTSISSLSDARDKKNIKDLSLGIDFLMSIRPRQFNWDRREWYADRKPDGSKIQETPTAGFISQELDEAQTGAHAEWLNLVLKNNPDRLEATPGNLLPIMVKAIQDLKTENDALKNELIALRSSLAEEVKKEVKEILLKAVQAEEQATKVSLK